jgi:Flp pilus assembly protein TadG
MGLKRPRIIEALVGNVRGNVALIVALCAPLLIGIVGFSVDYGYATYINQGLQAAADTAVLTATSQSAATAAGGYANTGFLAAYGTNVFQGNIAKLPVSNVNPNLVVAPNGNGGVVATASYTYSVPTFLSSIVGISTIPISGHASATATPLTYINYYFLVDISQSMGIGATPADMQTLYNRVVSYSNGSGNEAGCVFGCHVPETANGGGAQKYTNEYLAHSVSPAITLRIDSAVAAIQNVISLAKINAGNNYNIKIGLYTMSQDPVSGKLLNTVAAPSTNYASLTTAAGTIDLGNNTINGLGDSDFTDQLASFSSNVLPANGSGASAVSPRNYVFIITDGLYDSCGNTHCTATLNPANCNALKANATVGVIYTTFNPIYANNVQADGFEYNYQTYAAPYVGQIPAALQSCVSSLDFYYEADDGPAISSGMQQLFASSLKASRLQQ